MTQPGSGAPDEVWPEEIRLSPDKGSLLVTFEDIGGGALSAEFLRVWSPSAEVRGHGVADRKTVGGKRNVRITALEPVGNYAIRIVFDDGHDTGLYAWSLLRRMVAGHDAMWAEYLEALGQKGMRREPG